MRGSDEDAPVMLCRVVRLLVMSWEWRRWLHGPKQEPGQGFAVWGPDGAVDSAGICELLSQCPRLRAWARGHGLELDDGPGSLASLDRLSPSLPTEPGDPSGAGLRHDAGCYVGTVIVKHVPGAAWGTRRNGYPVIHLPSDRDVDIFEMVASQPDALASIYDDVVS